MVALLLVLYAFLALICEVYLILTFSLEVNVVMTAICVIAWVVG